jgi:YHS domain-containing protein
MLVRLLIWGLLGFVIYTVYQAVRRALSAPGRRPPEKTSRGEEMVQDPQCGTYLPKSEACPVQIDGRIIYFCSPECQQAYRNRKQA